MEIKLCLWEIATLTIKIFETNNLPKGEKGKTGHTHSDDLSALSKKQYRK